MENSMIRHARKEEIQRIMEIYDAARAFMRANGNLNQWSGGYPSAEELLGDIERKNLYAYETEDGNICACFALIKGIDPTYGRIDDGSWKSDLPYAAIHKVASDGTIHGFFAKCVQFARERYTHLRVDTHHDNYPMQHVILKNGFEYRGIIYLANGDPRKAYEWIK